MGRFDPAGAAGRLARAAKTTDWKGRAKHAAQTIRDEYQAGKRGDDAPAQPIWGSPKEQLDAVVELLRSAKRSPVDQAADVADADVAAVAEAMRGVDWSSVKAATAERTGDAARTMRTMAEQVDWAKVQPVAARVSSALIAAVASGQLGIGGRLGSTVARTIVDQSGLAHKVASRVRDEGSPLPPDFRGAIEVSSRDI